MNYTPEVCKAREENRDRMVTEGSTAGDRRRRLGLHQEDSAALHIAGQGSAGFSQGTLGGWLGPSPGPCASAVPNSSTQEVRQEEQELKGSLGYRRPCLSTKVTDILDSDRFVSFTVPHAGSIRGTSVSWAVKWGCHRHSIG